MRLKTVSLPGYKITQIFNTVQPTERKHWRLPLAESANFRVSSLATSISSELSKCHSIKWIRLYHCVGVGRLKKMYPVFYSCFFHNKLKGGKTF